MTDRVIIRLFLFDIWSCIKG